MAPAFLHYKLTPQADVFAARKMSSNASAGALEPITELDVIYGGKETSPLFGYNKVQTLITGDEDDEKRASTGGNRAGSALAFRKGTESELSFSLRDDRSADETLATDSEVPKAPTSRFSADGNFTILQVADLHFSVGPGECRGESCSLSSSKNPSLTLFTPRHGRQARSCLQEGWRRCLLAGMARNGSRRGQA